MPRGSPQEQLAILERRKNVAQRYLRGETQWVIARAFEVDQKTVSNDLKAIRLEWLASALRDFDALKAQELAKVDEIERAAWHGWAKSQEAAETLRAEDFGERKKQSVVRKGQAGDPRFLKVILECVERRCAILGVDAERRLKVTGLIEYANLSDAELDQRIAVAQSRIGGPPGRETPPPGDGGTVATSSRAPDPGP